MEEVIKTIATVLVIFVGLPLLFYFYLGFVDYLVSDPLDIVDTYCELHPNAETCPTN